MDSDGLETPKSSKPQSPAGAEIRADSSSRLDPASSGGAGLLALITSRYSVLAGVLTAILGAVTGLSNDLDLIDKLTRPFLDYFDRRHYLRAV